MNTQDPKLTALQFNEYINKQDIKGLSSLMTPDHPSLTALIKLIREKNR